MYEMRLQGDTLNKIGERFSISRERVRQLLNTYHKPYITNVNVSQFVDRVCKECHKEFKQQFFKKSKTRIFCGRKCMDMYRHTHLLRQTIEEKRAWYRARARAYYNTSVGRENIKRNSRNSYKKDKGKYQKEYFLRLKNDPIRYKKYLEDNRRRFYERKNK